jgi:hypothetical protein
MVFRFNFCPRLIILFSINMSSANDKLRKVSEKSKKGTWSKWLKTQALHLFSYGQIGSSFVYSYSRHIGWFIITTGIITALPLILEVKRESIVEELEQLQINMALAEGKTPQELANSGITSAIQPKVLT